MNDIEIRALYRDLKDPAENLKTANRQRKLAAEVISALFQKVEACGKKTGALPVRL